MDGNANKEILERKNHKHIPDSYSEVEVCKEILQINFREENYTYIPDSHSEPQSSGSQRWWQNSLIRRLVGRQSWSR